MENTEQLRNAIRALIDEKYEGVKESFFQDTETKKQTWYKILNGTTRHIHTKTEADLCSCLGVTELQLHSIAHYTPTEPTPTHNDVWIRLAHWIRFYATNSQQKMILQLAESYGFKKNNKQRGYHHTKQAIKTNPKQRAG